MLDLGAHAGQSAASVHLVQPGWRVLCFEPDPAVRWSLLATAVAMRGRMRFRLQGVAEHAGTRTLHVPMAGHRRIEGEASFDLETLTTDPITVARLEGLGMTGCVTLERPVVRIDELRLEPVAVKLDLQGGELSALRGALHTLRRHTPPVLMENNRNSGVIAELLAPLRYRPRGPFEALNVLFTVDG